MIYTYYAAKRLFVACDFAWQQELDRLYGQGARQARYSHLGKGETSARLRARWQARQDAQHLFNQANRTGCGYASF